MVVCIALMEMIKTVLRYVNGDNCLPRGLRGRGVLFSVFSHKYYMLLPLISFELYLSEPFCTKSTVF